MTKYVQNLLALLPKWIIAAEINAEEACLTIKPQYLYETMLFLRDHVNCQFKVLTYLTACDCLNTAESRFEVIYQLLSVRYNSRLTVKITTSEQKAVESLTGLFASANWFEREVWDLFGIFFSNHPDLRRLVTDYGFQGHPLRKDFPLCGYVELRYDDEEKRLVSEPLRLSQEFRSFDFTSPWETHS